MKNISNESEALTYAILDSLSANVAILDSKGTIVAVNLAWRNFCDENSARGKRANAEEGVNYLSICKFANGANSEEAGDMYNGLLSVMNQERLDYSIEYPCHSPTEKRWYRAYVTRLPIVNSSEIIVAHINITKEVLKELETRR